jgi:mono/diheme cytochrome c family protein
MSRSLSSGARAALVLILSAATLVLGLSSAQENKKNSAPPKPDAVKGRKVFQANCAECHYADSYDTKVGPGLKGLRDGKMPDGTPATHDLLLGFIDAGGDTMPAFKNLLTPEEKEDLIDYLLML